MRQPVSKMKVLAFSVVLLAHYQCTNTQGTQNAQNKKLQKSSSNFVPIVCHVCGFGLFFSPPD
jgi:hypothetical protein